MLRPLQRAWHIKSRAVRAGASYRAFYKAMVLSYVSALVLFVWGFGLVWFFLNLLHLLSGEHLDFAYTALLGAR